MNSKILILAAFYGRYSHTYDNDEIVFHTNSTGDEEIRESIRCLVRNSFLKIVNNVQDV